MATTLAVEKLGRQLGHGLDIASKEAIPFLKAFRSEIMVTHEDIGLTGRFLAEAVIEAIEKPSRPPRQKLLLPGAFE
jgi:LacI family transcriptional regulator